MTAHPLSPLPWLDGTCPTAPFPSPERALRDPDGLLAVGGGLEPERLLLAYRSGIFPWYADGLPILWWSPDPRLVLFPERFRCHRSLAKTGRQPGWRFTVNCAFEAVLRACASIPRRGQQGTWITGDMQAAYLRLHHLGWAQSLEVWHGSELAGGLYGLRMGGVFFGESMFSRRRDASKLALAALCQAAPANGLVLVDCQVVTPHLLSLGACPLPRQAFLGWLARCVPPDCRPCALTLAAGVPHFAPPSAKTHRERAANACTPALADRANSQQEAGRAGSAQANALPFAPPWDTLRQDAEKTAPHKRS